jgi:transcriptional regulator GlxA family with amidase domain
MAGYLRVGAEAGPGPEYETAELVNRVREARLQAGQARQEASRILARVSLTTVRVTSTQRQTARARERRRQLVASRAGNGRLMRERVSPPSAAPLTPPGRVLRDLAAQERFDSSPATLRRAVAFIHEQAGRPLAVADIAAASFVTVRAVQLAFRRHLDMTPMQYLRRVRLHRAYQDLLAADPARESVTAVAYRWKFASASRFTAYYREVYGVLPSHTLRSRP